MAVRLLLIFLLSGCSTTFHVFNAVDAVQTSQFRHNDCHEVWLKDVIGEEPKPAQTFAFFLATSLGYEAIKDRYSDRKWFPWFEWFAVTTKIYAVGRNVENDC